MLPLPLRVAIIGTNDPRNYSGGRYHGLIMAYALAASGIESHVVTDHLPAFIADCEPLAPGGVTFSRTADFVQGLPGGRFDWVIIVPTGIFLPDFYESCLDFAAGAGARVALINFESANWFNLLAPEPRDPRIWEYWRRCVVHGGLVLSSARVSDRFARDFYRVDGSQKLRFEVWSPPINSVAAHRFDGLPKDGSLLAFVRPQDRHKGSRDLTRIDPALFENRTLRLIAGRDVPAEFRADIEAHLARAPGSRLEIFSRISDLQKFRFMTAAQAVLFPSRFEGYGYPPVEAAYAGTESVCFELPVLRETVGGIAHFAPVDDMEAFGRAMAVALNQPERAAALRLAVTKFANFEYASGLLADILLRSGDAVAPLAARRFNIGVGPFREARVRDPADIDRAMPLPPLPSLVSSARFVTSGDVLATIAFRLPVKCDRVEAETAGNMKLPLAWSIEPGPKDSFTLRAHLAAPAAIVGHRIWIKAFAGDEPVGEPVGLQVNRIEARGAELPVRWGISQDSVDGAHRTVRGWIMAGRPIDEVWLTDGGADWWRAPVSGDRSDLLKANPGYPTKRCQYIFTLPAAVKLGAETRMLAVAGDIALEALAGWVPAAKSFFPADLKLGEVAVSPRRPAEPARPAPSARPAQRPLKKAEGQPAPAASRQEPARLARPRVDVLEVIDANDAAWYRGVNRTGGADRLGAVVIRETKAVAALKPGMVVRTASASARTVLGISKVDAGVAVVLDGPLDAYVDGFPATLDLFEPPKAGLTAERRSFVIPDWTDARWWLGIWNLKDQRWRRGFFMKADEAKAVGVAVGARLVFAASGMRSVIDTLPSGKDLRVWLDGPIRPMGDAGQSVSVAGAIAGVEDAIPFRPGPAGGPWATGILAADVQGPRRGAHARLAPTDGIVRGSALRFPSGRIARVVQSNALDNALQVALDVVLDPVEDGHPGMARLLDEVDVPAPPQPWLFPDPGYRLGDPLHLRMVKEARAHGRVVLPPGGKPRADRPRVMFVTLVPPCPANQGNRVVTRNFIRHLVDLGYCVDVVLQGWIDALEALKTFDERVRIISMPFPNWTECDAVAERRKVIAAADALRPGALDGPRADAIAGQANLFHPYFIVSDEVVETARLLATTDTYDAIVVNYTHMLRVVHELSRYVALPPVCVLTHDALSRLPDSFMGQKLDTMYRACTPETERDVLNAVPATVMAISQSEADYFRSLGVTNPIVLTEYDALSEFRPHAVPEDGFEVKALIFHGSGNPMNVAGLDWFVNECWADILAAAPAARLVVCGRIGERWKPKLPNIEVVGELDRAAMLELCGKASVAINPCVAGTGLKIKTVEAACMGLPAVCLPAAVEGLEPVAEEFAIVARTGAEFARGCIVLLSNRERWMTLRRSALALADARFQANAVYREIDRAMGWEKRAETLLAAAPHQPAGLRDGPEPTVAIPADSVIQFDRKSRDPGALLGMGLKLLAAGEAESGRRIVERIVASQRGDPRTAALAAGIALDNGDFWLAAVHGAVVIGQRPLEPDGYYQVGIGLAKLGQTGPAIECLKQGLLVAPHHAGLMDALHDALHDARRPAEAETWLALRPPECPIGEYFGLDSARLGGRGFAGWKSGADGALELAGSAASLRFLLPETECAAISFTLDLSVNGKGLAKGRLPVAARANDVSLDSSITLGGPPIQTLRGSLPATSRGPDRTLTLTLDFGDDPARIPKIGAIGMLFVVG